MKGILLLFTLTFAFFASTSNATEFYRTCNTCTTNSQFLAAADAASPPTGMHTVVVFNFNTATAKTYATEFVDSGGKFGGEKSIMLINNPTRVNKTLQLYNDLITNELGIDSTQSLATKSSLQSTVTFDGGFSLMNAAANGCGTPSDPVTYAIIPDIPFKSACDKHDICYGTSASKHTCDSNFLEDMFSIIDNIMINADIATAVNQYSISVQLVKAALEAALIKQAEIYHKAVVEREEALNAYCSSTTNPNPIECGGGNPVSQATEPSPVFVSTGHAYPQATGYKITCELWQFSDGSFRLLNCVTTLVYDR